MKTKLLLLLLATLSFSVSSCKETYTLKYKLSKGDSSAFDLKSIVSTSQSIMGQDVKSETDMNMKFHYNITNTQENDFTMEMIFDAIRMDMNMIMGENSMNITMDSSTEATSITPEDMGLALKAMTGLPIEMIISKKGKVLSVAGFEKFMESIITLMGENISPQEKAQAQQMMEQYMNYTTAESMFEQMSSYFPEKPVGIGETWVSSMSTTSNGTSLVTNMNLTLKAVKDNIATIEIDGTSETAEDNTQTIEGMEVTTTFTGVMTGTVYIDINTGWPTQCELNQNVSGTMSIQGMTIPMDMTSKTVITGSGN